MKISVRQFCFLLLCLALTAALAACGASVPSSTLPPASEPPQSTQPGSTPTAEPSPTAEPLPTSDTPPVVEEPTYQFGTPLAEGEPVEDTHFDTAVFLGDSRTEGLQLFGGIRNGDYYWARGMTVFRADDSNYAVFEIDGRMYTMIGALRQKEYQSVYIMIGVNELGYPASSYEKGMRTLVDLVLEAQPDAVIYLQILPPVNEEVAQKNGLASYINNTNIEAFNSAIVRIAAEKKVVLLDTAEVYRDENGILPADMASDGCHFNYGDYAPWADYLRTHVMDREDYLADRALALRLESEASSDEEVNEP